MPIDVNLLQVLVCPEDKSALTPASREVIDQLNLQIEKQQVKNRKGQVVTEKLEEGLVRTDGKFIYPVRENIPVLLIEEAISIPLGI